MQNQEFLAFWGWQSLPWNEPVSNEQLYWQERTELVAGRLLFSLNRAAQMSVITAPAGHGKSTFAKWLYHRLDPKTHDVALFSLMQKENSGNWLMVSLAGYLGIEVGESKELIRQLHRAQTHGKILTIIVDEAHKLSDPDAFETLLGLGRSAPRIGFGLNCALIGQASLIQNLQKIEGIRHRFGLCTELQVLSPSELAGFVSHRLALWRLPPKTVQREALDLLMQNEVVTFAAVESVLETCLVEAFLREQRNVGPDIMTRALKFLGFIKNGDELMADGSRASAAQRRRSPVVAAPRASGAALDLNSLYYKSDDGQDPEQS